MASRGVLLPIVEDDLNEDNISWRTSLSWKPNADTMLYATVARGYKAGSFTVLSAIFAAQQEPARQETVLSYEAGFKLSAADRKIQLTGSGFYYDYQDKQITGGILILPFGALPRLQNIPKAGIWRRTGSDGAAVRRACPHRRRHLCELAYPAESVSADRRLCQLREFRGRTLPEYAAIAGGRGRAI